MPSSCSRGLRLLALLVIASTPALANFDSACPKGERCADDRLAAEFVEFLGSRERTFVSRGASHHDAAVSIAAREVAWETVRAQPGASVEVRAIVASELINDYLGAGLSAEALALYRALDSDVQERATMGAVVHGRHGRYPNSIYLEASPQLTAAGLAVACADIDDGDCTETLLKRAELPVDPGPLDTFDDGLSSRSRSVGRCARAVVASGRRLDPFLFRFGSEGGSDLGAGCSFALQTRAYLRRSAALVAASDLPEAWHLGLEPNIRTGMRDSNQKAVDSALKQLPQGVERIARLRSILGEIDRQDDRWVQIWKKHDRGHGLGDENTRSKEVAVASELDRGLAGEISGRLSKAIYNPYRMEPTDRSRKQLREAPISKQACGKQAIRCIDVGATHWELAMSQDYDPTGEVPAAGFWLRRSGSSESSVTAYYLGLKEHRPYELAPSADPLIVEDELRLVVKRAEIDPEEIAFPPIGLTIESDKSLFEIRASLADIIRDSDEDGLTDLAEQQLLLDASDPDTDDDGEVDATDALPNVAFNPDADSRKGAFAAALAHLLGQGDDAISFLVPASKQFVRRRSSDERTLFVVTDPENLSGLVSDRRIIVLPESLTRKALDQHPAFAVFYPMRLSLRMLDERHAILIHNSGWVGGTLALEWHEGHWRVGVLGAWIT